MTRWSFNRFPLPCIFGRNILLEKFLFNLSSSSIIIFLPKPWRHYFIWMQELYSENAGKQFAWKHKNRINLCWLYSKSLHYSGRERWIHGETSRKLYLSQWADQTCLLVYLNERNCWIHSLPRRKSQNRFWKNWGDTESGPQIRILDGYADRRHPCFIQFSLFQKTMALWGRIPNYFLAWKPVGSSRAAPDR